MVREEEILVEIKGGLGVLTLNRPKALNALSLDMIRRIKTQLESWAVDERIAAVFIRGAGEKAFCAGADIKACYEACMQMQRGEVGIEVPLMFFEEEFALNRYIHHYSKPLISFMNGITMGGGYGLAGHCRYRVVTDKTRFAMPEVKLGFFPDVGVMYHLSRMKYSLGLYLAMTGNILESYDSYAFGVGEYYIPCEKEEALIEALHGGDSIEDVLQSFVTKPDSQEPLEGHLDRIRSVFAHGNVPDILQALEDEGSEWSQGILDAFHTDRCPLSLFVVAKYYNWAKDKRVDEVLDADLILVRETLSRTDFYEGVRAVVIDKTHVPEWNPKDIQSVRTEDVDGYFRL